VRVRTGEYAAEPGTVAPAFDVPTVNDAVALLRDHCGEG
jgi:hypothetical protein